MFSFLAEPGRQPRRHVFLFCRPAAGLLDDEGFLKDFAFGRPSAGPASWLTGQNLGVMFFFLAGQAGRRRHVFFLAASPASLGVMFFYLAAGPAGLGVMFFILAVK